MTEQIAVGHIELGESFERHRVRGFVPHAAARGMNPRLDVSLISHVEGNLWQGGCMNQVPLPEGFKHVFSLYPWEEYKLPAGCERVTMKMYDALDQDTTHAQQFVDAVLVALEDGPTLVHCQAGLNRSGLIAGLTLVRLGYTGDAAVKKLRKSRCELVLSNEAFENVVRAAG